MRQISVVFFTIWNIKIILFLKLDLKKIKNKNNEKKKEKEGNALQKFLST